MKVNLLHDGATLTAFLHGELDHHGAAEVREAIDTAVTRQKPKLLILDFKEVPFSDSSGIAVALGRYKLMNTLCGKIRIVNTSKQVKKVFFLSGVQKYISIE